MDLKLSGRVYYVTGGSRGVGLAIVKLLLADGASVATCARHAKGLDELKAELNDKERSRLLIHMGDVLDQAQVEKWIQETHAHFGRLDGVVANAGSGKSGCALESPNEVWTDQFNIKVHSVLNLVRPAIEFLKASDAGRVVIINSVTAHYSEPTMAAVSAARAAVENLSQSLAVKLSISNICINTVNLGVIATERQHQRYKESGAKETFEFWSQQEAMRRGVLFQRMGTPEEVAPAVALLLSPLASYITRSSIDVAGGMRGSTNSENHFTPACRL